MIDLETFLEEDMCIFLQGFETDKSSAASEEEINNILKKNTKDKDSNEPQEDKSKSYMLYQMAKELPALPRDKSAHKSEQQNVSSSKLSSPASPLEGLSSKKSGLKSPSSPNVISKKSVSSPSLDTPAKEDRMRSSKPSKKPSDHRLSISGSSKNSGATTTSNSDSSKHLSSTKTASKKALSDSSKSVPGIDHHLVHHALNAKDEHKIYTDAVHCIQTGQRDRAISLLTGLLKRKPGQVAYRMRLYDAVRMSKKQPHGNRSERVYHG